MINPGPRHPNRAMLYGLGAGQSPLLGLFGKPMFLSRQAVAFLVYMIYINVYDLALSANQ